MICLYSLDLLLQFYVVIVHLSGFELENMVQYV